MSGLAKTLMLSGAVIFVAGAVIGLSGRIPALGRLPGDIHIRKGDFSFYFPVTTSIIISIVVSLVLYLAGRLK